MTNALQHLFIGSLIGTAVITIFIGFLGAMDTTYDQSRTYTDLVKFNKTDDLSAGIGDVRDSVLTEGEVTTEESEASFFRNAFTASKQAANNLDVVFGGNGLLWEAAETFGLGATIPLLLFSILGIIVAFAVIKLITGS